MGQCLQNETKSNLFLSNHLKHAVRIVCNADKLTNSFSLLRSLITLNVYQINLYQHLAFMYKFNKNKVPLTFNELFKKSLHKYKMLRELFQYASSLKSTKCSISFCGPKIWNKFLTKEREGIPVVSNF